MPSPLFRASRDILILSGGVDFESSVLRGGHWVCLHSAAECLHGVAGVTRVAALRPGLG